MAKKNYLGNSNTMVVHNLSNEHKNCQIDEIKDEHRVYFSSLDEAHRAGYKNDCDWCIGGSKS